MSGLKKWWIRFTHQYRKMETKELQEMRDLALKNYHNPHFGAVQRYGFTCQMFDIDQELMRRNVYDAVEKTS